MENGDSDSRLHGRSEGPPLRDDTDSGVVRKVRRTK